MKAYDNGAFFTVTCSERDVEGFARRWPCFGNVKPYWFQFDKRNGDLVDTNHQDGETNDHGILALCEDAKKYGIKRLRLDVGAS
jgi:hypothetical protein